MRQAEALHRLLSTQKGLSRLGHVRHDEVTTHGVEAGRDRPDVPIVDGCHAGNGQQPALQPRDVDFGRRAFIRV